MSKFTYEGKKTKTVLTRDFTKAWNPSEFAVQFGTDGVESQSSSGLKITSAPFTFTSSLPGQDYLKYLRYFNTPIVLSTGYESIFEMNVSAKQSIDINAIPANFLPRIRNVREDFRLCNSLMAMIDPVSFIVCDFMITDNAIYAFYERKPFGKPAWTGNSSSFDYAAFSQAELVARRTGSLNDTIRLGIGLDKSRGVINWYVDGKKVFTWSRVGMKGPEHSRILDNGGTEQLVFPDSILFGFGNLSLLDYALPNNYSRELVSDNGSNKNIAQSQLVQLDPTDFYREIYPGLDGENRTIVDPSQTFAYVKNQLANDNAEIKLFGQGMTTLIKNLSVFQARSTIDESLDT